MYNFLMYEILKIIFKKLFLLDEKNVFHSHLSVTENY